MVDLHLHTTASDGTLSPAGLVEAAASRGVRVMAVTDHDTCAGIPEALACAHSLSDMTLIPGVELSAGADTEVHILGYGVDGRSPSMRRIFDDMHAARVARHHEIVENLKRLGIDMSDLPLKPNPGRLHIAHELVRRGASPNVQASMRDYLVEGGRAFAPRPRPAFRDALRAIREAGGVAVLAHPGPLLGGRPDAAAFARLHALIDDGLGGLECYHGACPADVAERLRAIAEREGLLITGGSDFHGGNKPGVDILSGLGGWRDAEQCAARLLETIGNH